MNRKPVIFAPQGNILNMESGFKEKELCDGPTFSASISCAFSCSFCFVGPQLARHPVLIEAKRNGLAHEDVVVRRTNAIQSLKDALLTTKGTPRFSDPNDRRVIYSSPLADVAGNMELVRETIEACLLILELTSWQIRLLSKSNLLPYVAAGIPPQHKSRMIFGVSTGTLNDSLARAFEEGTPLVSRRIDSIHELQDDGWRTFGMVCPSLPMSGNDYREFATEMAITLRVDRMEKYWAEAINVRGESMTRTRDALSAAGFKAVAGLVETISADRPSWEAYARSTFEAHAAVIPAEKLRFLQYVTAETAPWWAVQIPRGAVLLGKAAHG